MTDRTSIRKEITPASGTKVIILKTAEVVTGATDTLTMTLADFGVHTVLAVHAWVQTTANSVMVSEAGTTAVADGVLTYTTITGNNNKRRVVVVWGV